MGLMVGQVWSAPVAHSSEDGSAASRQSSGGAHPQAHEAAEGRGLAGGLSYVLDLQVGPRPPVAEEIHPSAAPCPG